LSDWHILTEMPGTDNTEILIHASTIHMSVNSRLLFLIFARATPGSLSWSLHGATNRLYCTFLLSCFCANVLSLLVFSPCTASWRFAYKPVLHRIWYAGYRDTQ